MGNQTTKPLKSCGLNLLPAETLAQTSLQPLNKRTNSPVFLARSPVQISRLDKNGQVTEKRDSPDKPDSKDSSYSPQRPHDHGTVTENDFHTMQVLSCEKLGRVFLVKKNDTGKLYAMKTFCKKKVKSLDCFDSFDVEKNILEDARHPFIPHTKYTFENDKKISLLTDYFEASELHKILRSLNRFSEEITRFYSAEILTVLEYLHKEMNVIFTQLKLEHILVDSHGHIKLANFEGAQYGNRYKSNFWDLGCLIYEMLTGNKLSESSYSHIEDLDQDTLEKNIHWSNAITVTAKDLVIRLLSGKIDEALGFASFDEIKKHPFFSDVKWNKIHSKSVYPPLSPSMYKDVEEEEVVSFNEKAQPSFHNFEVPVSRVKKGLIAERVRSCDQVFEAGLSTNDN